MLYSRSSEYAIRAFVFLAGQEPGCTVLAKDIATNAGLPAQFLAKLLQQLARTGLLRSTKGPSGGFTLSQPPGDISLYDIIDALDGANYLYRCPAGHDMCTKASRCPMHDGWMPVQSRIVDYLEQTTLADIVKPAARRPRGPKGAKRKAVRSR